MYGHVGMLIYAAIGAVGFLLLIGMLVLGDLFGGDHDLGGDHDVGHGITVDHADADYGAGPSVFSVRMMAAFLTAFGVGGVVGRYYELSHPTASGIGVVCGVMMAGLVYQFAKLLYSQQASSEIRVSSLVGKTAEVSVAIPPGGVGQVSLTVAGERSEHIARSAAGDALPRGTEVVVTGLRGDSLVVASATPPVPGGAR
jgi:membrane protein implicated in regulation of membrane protease activity